MDDSKFKQLIQKLHQHPDMAYVWDKVDSTNFFKPTLVPINHNRDAFISLISASLKEKTKTESYTESEFNEWETNIHKSAKNLIKLLNGSYLNYSSFTQEAIDTGNTKNILSSFDKSYVNVLEKLICDIPKERIESIRSKRPNDPKSKQTYFIKKISKELIFHTNKKNLKVIAILASIVFDLSEPITESQISRVLKVDS